VHNRNVVHKSINLYVVISGSGKVVAHCFNNKNCGQPAAGTVIGSMSDCWTKLQHGNVSARSRPGPHPDSVAKKHGPSPPSDGPLAPRVSSIDPHDPFVWLHFE